MQLVFKIRNKDAGGELGVAHTPKYTGAMVKLLQWRHRGSVNPVHSMVEVEPWSITIGRNPQFFISEKIYFLAYIIKMAHVIPATLTQVQY